MGNCSGFFTGVLCTHTHTPSERDDRGAQKVRSVLKAEHKLVGRKEALLFSLYASLHVYMKITLHFLHASVQLKVWMIFYS